MDYALYTASVLGALALLLMMPPRHSSIRLLGALLGASTLGGVWLFLSRFLPVQLGMSQWGLAYYYIFSAIAIGSAVRVITHHKPVFSALWFVMVVMATAGLFLVLSAEFMAVAMVIIYAGAILVTYMFVIMLASQTKDGGEGTGAGDEEPEYDRVAREPVAAVAAGFFLLAALLGVMFQPIQSVPGAAAPSDADIIHGTAGSPAVLTNRPAVRLAARLEAEGLSPARVRTLTEAGAAIPSPAQLSNAERVGLDLFRSHPLGLELAGVILLVSLVGAVVIARKRVEPEATG